MTTSFAGGWRGAGSRHRHRRGRRPRLSLVLLDPPSVTGLPPDQLSGFPLRRARGRGLIAIVAAAALALSALAGVAVALRSARAPAPFPHITLVAPFPSLTAGGRTGGATPPGATASPHAAVPAQTMTHPSAMPVMTAPVTLSPAMTVTPVMASPSPAAAQPSITVTYAATPDGYDTIEGEVAVGNTGSSQVSGWQIVVSLPYDQFTAVSGNAAGYASHHVLVLQPASGADSVPANGTLTVFFTAYGTQTTPESCAFNGIPCQ